MSDIHDDGPSPVGELNLATATDQLRGGAADDTPSEVAGRIRRVARSAPRRSTLVRANPPHAYLRVSTLVITAALHERLAPLLDGDAAVRRVHTDVDRDHHLTSLVVDLVVRYGVSIATLGDRASRQVRDTLDEILGLDPSTATDPEIGRVHVVDVTVGDPSLVDPADE